MTLRRYERYKDSRVEWLGAVPAHWDVQPIKRRLLSVEQGWSPQCENFPAESGQWGVLKVGCVNGGRFHADENKALPADLEPLPELGIRRGDVLVSRANTRELVGSVAVVDRDYDQLLLCDKLYRLRVMPDRCEPSFLAHFIGSAAARSVIEAVATGASSSMLNIAQGAVAGMSMPLPPVDEQRALLRFLDAETAKIDTLIAEQQRLIELLTEKRQAVIAHAVTKGLNPAAPMKDSGVEWLGDVPTHWNAVPIKRLLRSVEQGWSPQCENYPASPGQWGVLKVGCVNGGQFSSVENKALPTDMAPIPALSLRCGDVLVSRANTRGLVGSAAVVEQDSDHLLLCDKLYRLRVKRSEIDPTFLALFLGCPLARGVIESAATGASSSMLNISQAAIVGMRIALPPISEQTEIVEHMRVESRRFDGLIAESNKAASLLRERRTALISAAVTGQIDVRQPSPTRSTPGAHLQPHD